MDFSELCKNEYCIFAVIVVVILIIAYMMHNNEMFASVKHMHQVPMSEMERPPLEHDDQGNFKESYVPGEQVTNTMYNPMPYTAHGMDELETGVISADSKSIYSEL